MKITVENEQALPNGCTYYVRSLSDPLALIHGRSGDAYFRADGQPWKHPGYTVSPAFGTDPHDLTPTGTWHDEEVYG